MTQKKHHYYYYYFNLSRLLLIAVGVCVFMCVLGTLLLI